MIKLEKKVAYYKKDSFIGESKLLTKTFYNIEEAFTTFENINPKYYINKKDISAIETINLIYKIELGYKRYYKTIDPTSEEIETNYIKET